MREIRFRAWDKVSNSMWMVADIRFAFGNYEPKDVLLEDFQDSGKRIMAKPCDIELMQFTGLKDMNDKEIWEGDILQYLPAYPPIIQIIKWGARGWENTEGNLMSEVIGNVWENPELLETK